MALILIELYHRHLKACTEVILLFAFSVLTYVALKPIKFWTHELFKIACSLFLAHNEETNKLASCNNYRK
jgi:hypothetical protein